MTEATRNILVGLFVIAAVVVLGTLMVWFGEVPDWIATGEWNLRVADVKELRGVGSGSPVKLQGVEIGRVKGIEFRNPENPAAGVVIVCRIKRQYSIPKDSVARVYGATLGFGTGHIDIIIKPDARPELLDKEDPVIFGEMRSIFGEIVKKELVDSVEYTVEQIGGLAESARPVMEGLNQLIEQRSIAQVDSPDAAERGLHPNLSTVVERTDQLIANVNAVLGDGDVQGDVRLAVRDLKDATQSLKDLLERWNTESLRLAENLNTGVDRTEENLEDTFRRLYQVLDNMDTAARNLATVTYALTDTRGTAGLVLNDPRLYESAVLAFDRLADVLADIKAITSKVRDDGYITVGQAPTGVLRKRFPVPGAGTVERQ
jgi:phospholipid/cholesterol/gamma-HCH transport system substrate-binding protein